MFEVDIKEKIDIEYRRFKLIYAKSKKILKYVENNQTWYKYQ